MKSKQWILKCMMIGAIAITCGSTAISVSAAPRDWDDRGRDSRELRRDYEKLHNLNRKIEHVRNDLREAEHCRDWRKVRRLEDELERLRVERHRVEYEIERDRDRNRNRYDRDYRRGDRR